MFSSRYGRDASPYHSPTPKIKYDGSSNINQKYGKWASVPWCEEGRFKTSLLWVNKPKSKSLMQG